LLRGLIDVQLGKKNSALAALDAAVEGNAQYQAVADKARLFAS